MHVIRFTLPFMLFTSCLFAENITIVGSMQQSIPISLPNSASLKTKAAIPHQQVTVLKMKLSDDARKILNKKIDRVRLPYKQSEATPTYPKSVQLGMDQVPVLDQGRHGTCVTFAVTAAIDAAIHKGDYISQLCQLQLGNHLESYAYANSGWEGSWGSDVLKQMDLFGIVNKAEQKANSCGGLTEYPVNESSHHTEMTVPEYHQMSERLAEELVVWSGILDAKQATDRDMNNILNDVKASLTAGDRLVFGMLIPDVAMGIVGALGTHHATNDTWVLTPEILEVLQSGQAVFAGHEMIITGFDDDAIAIDSNGNTSRGLLTLRNSWGKYVGDHGDFYLSYDYFKTLVDDIQRIRHL